MKKVSFISTSLILICTLFFTSCVAKDKAGVFFDSVTYESQKKLYNLSPLTAYTLNYSYIRGDDYLYNPPAVLEKTKDGFTLTFDTSAYVEKAESQDEIDSINDSKPKEDSAFYITDISDLFTFVDKKLESWTDFCNRYPNEFHVEISVTYHEKYHFPTEVVVYANIVEKNVFLNGLSQIKLSVDKFFVTE